MRCGNFWIGIRRTRARSACTSARLIKPGDRQAGIRGSGGSGERYRVAVVIALTEALAAMATRFADGLAWGESQEINDVLDAAAAWAARELPLEVFANTGTTLSPVSGKPSAAYARYLATI